MAWYGTAWHDMAWCRTARHSLAQFGTAGSGQGVARCGTVHAAAMQTELVSLAEKRCKSRPCVFSAGEPRAPAAAGEGGPWPGLLPPWLPLTPLLQHPQAGASRGTPHASGGSSWQPWPWQLPRAPEPRHHRCHCTTARKRGWEREPPASQRWRNGTGQQEGPGAWGRPHCRVPHGGRLCPAQPRHGATGPGTCRQPQDTSEAWMRHFAEPRPGLLHAAERGVCKGLPHGRGLVLTGTGGCFWGCFCPAGCSAAHLSLAPRGIKTCCGTGVSLGVSCGSLGWGQLMAAAAGVFSTPPHIPSPPASRASRRAMPVPRVLLEGSGGGVSSWGLSRGCVQPRGGRCPHQRPRERGGGLHGPPQPQCPGAEPCQDKTGRRLPHGAARGAQQRRAQGQPRLPWVQRGTRWAQFPGGSLRPRAPHPPPPPLGQGTAMGSGIPGAGPGLFVALQPLAGLGGSQGWIPPSMGTRATSSPSLLTPQVPSAPRGGPVPRTWVTPGSLDLL